MNKPPCFQTPGNDQVESVLTIREIQEALLRGLATVQTSKVYPSNGDEQWRDL